jgi:hypothetical protein
MKLKAIERVLAVGPMVVWVLMMMRAHTLNPDAFYEMEPLIIMGSLAVLILVVLSLATKRPLLGEKKTSDAITPGPTSK